MSERPSRWTIRDASLLLGVLLTVIAAGIATAEADTWERYGTDFASVTVPPDWVVHEVSQGVRIVPPEGIFAATFLLRIHPAEDEAKLRARGYAPRAIDGRRWLAMARSAEGSREISLITPHPEGAVHVTAVYELSREDPLGAVIEVMIDSLRLAP